MALTPTLKSFCSERGIHLREESRDVLVLNNVPVDVRAMNKPKTNLCVAREPKTGAFVAWVDSDLRPRDTASPAARLLSGMTKGHWQLVAHPLALRSAEQAVVETVCGLNGERPVAAVGAAAPLRGDVLPAVGTRLDLSTPRPGLLYREQIVDVASKLLAAGTGAVLLVGPSGSGLTACAVESLATHVQAVGAGAEVPVVRVDCALAATEMLYPASTDERVRQLMADCLAEPAACYLFDNVQWLLGAGALAQAAVVAALERQLRCVATLELDVFPSNRLIATCARRLHWIELPPLERGELLEIVGRRAQAIEKARGVRIEPEVIPACLRLSAAAPGADPGRCLNLLESAVALVAGTGTTRVGPDEVAAAARTFVPIES